MRTLRSPWWIAIFVAASVAAVAALIVPLFAGREARGITDPTSLTWRHALPNGIPPGVVTIDHLATINGRAFGFAAGPFGEAGTWAVTRVVSSPDGINWEVERAALDGLAVTATASDRGRVWAFGQRQKLGRAEREVWLTRDGRTWQRIEGTTGLDFGDGAVLRAATHDSVFVVLAYHSHDVETGEWLLLRSGDARRWKRVPLPRGPSHGVVDVTAGDGGFVVTFVTDDDNAGSVAEAWLSADGEHWTRHPIPGAAPNFAVADAAASGNTYVATGAEYPVPGPPRAAAWFSADGRQWGRGDVLDASGDEGSISKAVAAGTGFVALGTIESASQLQGAWASRDGRMWLRIQQWPVETLFAIDAIATPDFVVATSQLSRPDGTATVAISVGRPP